MRDRELLVPWVEKVLMEVINEDHVHHADDGAYPIRLDNTFALIRVDLDPAQNVRVQIFAPLLRDVEASPGLFERLNELNLRLAYFRFRWRDGLIEAETELVGEAFRAEAMRVTLAALDAYAAQMSELLEAPEATPWKSVMEMAEKARDGECANPAPASGTEDDVEDADGAVTAASGGAPVARIAPVKRKGRMKREPARGSDEGAEAYVPPGYL